MTYEEGFKQIKAIVDQMSGNAVETPIPGATNSVHCNEHGVEMVSKVSKKSGKPYLSHFERTEDGEWRTCFGKGWQ